MSGMPNTTSDGLTNHSTTNCNSIIKWTMATDATLQHSEH